MSRCRAAILIVIGITIASPSSFGDAMKNPGVAAGLVGRDGSLAMSDQSPSLILLSAQHVVTETSLFSIAGAEPSLSKNLGESSSPMSDLLPTIEPGRVVEPLLKDPVYEEPKLTDAELSEPTLRVPEPMSFALVTGGAILVLATRRRFRKNLQGATSPRLV